MTALNPLTSRSNTPAVFTATDHSVIIGAHTLQTAITVSMLTCALFEDPRVYMTEDCQNKRLIIKTLVISSISLYGILSDRISNQKEEFSKGKLKQKEIQETLRLEKLVIILKGILSSILFLMPNLDSDQPRLPITASLIVLNAFQDSYMRYYEQSIPEFFGPLAARIDRCRARLILFLPFRSKIAATRLASLATLVSSRPDSRCRRVCNGMWSVVTTSVNGVKRGFSCKRRNKRDADLDL